MKTKSELVGERFLKVTGSGGLPNLEYVHVMEHEAKGDAYLVAFWSADYNTSLGQLPHSSIAWVQADTLEGYAATNQKKAKKLEKHYSKFKTLAAELQDEAKAITKFIQT